MTKWSDRLQIVRSRIPAVELTPRERDVLRLLSQDKPNNLIGSKPTISEVTVESHVQALFRKLNVLSRKEGIFAKGIVAGTLITSPFLGS